MVATCHRTAHTGDDTPRASSQAESWSSKLCNSFAHAISGALASYQMSCDTPPFLHCYAAMYAPQHSRVSFLRAAGYSRRCPRRLFLTVGRLSHDNPASTAAVTFLIAPLTVPFFAVRSVAWIHRSLVTNQDELDLLWPDPLSLTHYQWKYSKEEAPNVIR